MKGIITAGGLGTRLRPLTLITNKHLLPVYNKPMILYPIETLKNSGINEIMIVCGKEHAGGFMNFLASGKNYGVKLSYAIQEKDNAGIADAINCAKDFADENDIAVILGDNIFEENFKKDVENFKSGAMVFLKKIKNPQKFGVAVFDKTGKKLIKIEEKPQKPKSDFAQVGFYIFDNKVFDIIANLKPSNRGELEITDVANAYLNKNELNFSFVKRFWSDAGSFESLTNTAYWVYKKSQ